MSSIHRVLGRPCRLRALNRVSIVGSHFQTSVVQSNSSLRASFRAHFHFLLRCIEIQSSICKFCILCSASCVHRLIQSVHGSSSVVSLSSFSLGGTCVADVVLFVSSSLSVNSSRSFPFSRSCCLSSSVGDLCACVVKERRGEWRIMRII